MSFTISPPFKQLVLGKFGGLYLEADPRSLPMGSSPLNWDVDFLISEVNIRPGLRNAIAFDVANLSGYAAAAADGSDWSGVANAIGPPDGSVASVTPPGSGSSETNQPATIAQSTGSAPSWSNPGNIISTNPSNYASVVLTPSVASKTIYCSGFGFSIPSGATILGVLVSFMGASNQFALSGGMLASIGFLSSGVFTPNGGQESTPLNVGSLAAASLGANNDLWMGTWLPSDFNSSSFCVALTAQQAFVVSPHNPTCGIDANDLSVTVYYSLPPHSSSLFLSEYAFSILAGASVTGIKVNVTCSDTGSGGIEAQLCLNGALLGTPKDVNPPSSLGLVSLGSSTDSWNVPNLATIISEVGFGVAFFASSPGTANIDAAQIQVFLSPPSAPFFGYLKSSHLPAGLVQTLALDSNGTLWQESIASLPGIMDSFYTEIMPNSRALSETIAAHEFMCFSDFLNPTDQPRQWDGMNLDRISQVGPGAGPQITVNNSQYPIAASPAGITQPFQQVSIYRAFWASTFFSQGAPPGTMLTIFGPPNGPASFIGGVNVGDFIYLDSLPTMGTQNPNGTYVVQAVGTFIYKGDPVYYIAVTASASQTAQTNILSGATYRKTSALVRLLTPIAAGDAQVGGSLSITGASPSGWNATWPIVGTPTEGQLLITATSLTSGIATYNYSLVSGVAPGWQPAENTTIGQQIVDPTGNLWQVTTAGTTGGSIPAFVTSPQTDNTTVWTKVSGQMYVTIFNTTNGGGAFNVTSVPIASATQTQFTVAIDLPDISPAVEQGSAISGQGTLFQIDPGQTTLGTGNPGTSPFFGDGGGGEVVVSGQIAAGERYAILLFITRNGFYTPASPPVQFYTSENTVAIKFTALCIGPPNVVGRAVALTPAGGAIGGPYFIVENDVVVPNLVSGGSTTFSKTIINDNTSNESGDINLSDAVLLTGTPVTIQGDNALQQRELGACLKVALFANRAFYLGEQAKIDQFVNLTFDGGSLVFAPNNPAGWQVDSGLQDVIHINASPAFGNTLYLENEDPSVIFNPTGTSPATLYQDAYQTPFMTPIVQPATAYSVRVTARVPSGKQTGSLVVGLYSPTMGKWEFSIPFASLGEAFQIITGAFNNPLWQSVPADLVLRVYPVNLQPNGGDVEIERIDVFPTEQPVYQNQLAASYAEDYEAIDGVTGIVDTSGFTREPQKNAFEWMDILYIATTGHTFATTDNNATEPAGWQIREISNTVGCFGPAAADVGEQYVLVADPRGLFVFDGGNHEKISQEIQPLWNLINKSYGHTVWVRNDIYNKRILIGAPIPTPNQWLPDAPVNSNPTTPNVILMCSYLGLESGKEIASGGPVHVSMFTGHLLSRDMVRKWTIWQIPSPACSFIDRPDGTEQIWFGGTDGTGQIYYLDPSAADDVGAAIPQTYIPYCFSDEQTEQVLQIGSARKLWGYVTMLLEGEGKYILTAYRNTLGDNRPKVYPARPLILNAQGNANTPINVTGHRMFLKFAVDGIPGSYFSLKRLVLAVQGDPWIPVGGR